jgi:hypothetical protein
LDVAYFPHVSRARNITMNERDQENPNTRMIPGLLGAGLIRRLGHDDATVAPRSAASVPIMRLIENGAFSRDS